MFFFDTLGLAFTRPATLQIFGLCCIGEWVWREGMGTFDLVGWAGALGTATESEVGAESWLAVCIASVS